MMDEKLLIGATEAARLLSMSRSFFYSQLACGKIAPQPLPFGKKKLWRLEDLKRWVADGCQPAKD